MIRIAMLTGGYAAAAALCLMARGDRAAWRAIALGVALLGADRLLGLHLIATRGVAGAALRQGWYAARRPIQGAVVALLLALVVGALLACAHRLGPRGWAVQTAAEGIVLLAGLTLIRAVSLHQVDALLARRLGPLSVGNLVEAALLLAVIGATLLAGPLRNGGG